MLLDDRFDDLVASLGGFHRTWYIVTGLELGLFARLREAGTAGMTADELARRTGTEPALIGRWAWGAGAHDLIELEDDRLRVPEDVAGILLDANRPEYLGGQFLHAAIGSLDFGDLTEVLRTGVPKASRPDRYRQAIERLTVQDIAVFFQEVLPAVPQLVIDLQPGSRILDIHCGGGRWLIAMARRFPGTTLTGIEFEPDSVTRARAAVEAAVLADRITIEARRCHRRRTRGPGDAGLLPVRAPPAAGPGRGDPLGMGRPQARWLARRPRLVPADGSRGAPDPSQRAARGHAARRAPGWDAAGHALRGAGLVRGRRGSDP